MVRRVNHDTDNAPVSITDPPNMVHRVNHDTDNAQHGLLTLIICHVIAMERRTQREHRRARRVLDEVDGFTSDNPLFVLTLTSHVNFQFKRSISPLL